MSNSSPLMPCFGQYRSLLTAPVTTEWAAINQYLYVSFFRTCLLRCGFLPVIRDLNEDTLFLKLYYFPDKVRNHKREMESFVSSFYLHGELPLSYRACNMIQLPITPVALLAETELPDTMPEAEYFLQSLLQEDDWVGMDFSGKQGGLTTNACKDTAAHERQKALLLEGYMEAGYEERILQQVMNRKEKWYPEFFTIRNEKDKSTIAVAANRLCIRFGELEKGNPVVLTTRFTWKGILVELVLRAWRAERSRGTRVVATFEGRSWTFGLGDSSVGAGSMGASPVIKSGNEKLVFSTGFHYLEIKEVDIDPHLAVDREKTESVFTIIT